MRRAQYGVGNQTWKEIPLNDVLFLTACGISYDGLAIQWISQPGIG